MASGGTPKLKPWLSPCSGAAAAAGGTPRWKPGAGGVGDGLGDGLGVPTVQRALSSCQVLHMNNLSTRALKPGSFLHGLKRWSASDELQKQEKSFLVRLQQVTFSYWLMMTVEADRAVN